MELLVARTAPTLLRACLRPALSATAAGTRGLAAEAAAQDRVVDVESDADFKLKLDGVNKDGGLAVVDFTAKWCGPCRVIGPIFKQLSAKYPSVAFLKVDIDTAGLAGTVTEHNISGVPTFIFYKNGKKVEGFSGARPDLLEDLLKKHSK